MKKISILVLFLYIFLSGGSIEAGGMYENVDVEGVHLTENTRVKVLDQYLLLKEDTQAMFYIQDDVVSDHLYTGTIVEQVVFNIQDKKLEIPADTKVWFYKSGKLKYTIAISKPIVFRIQGKEVLFTAQYDLYVPMGFHENGNFRRGILAEETSFKVQDKSIIIKGMSEFSETGQLLSGILARDETFIIQDNPIVFHAEKAISFHRNGSVKNFVSLENDTFFRVQNKMVLFASIHRSFQSMEFFENGDVGTGSLAEDTIFTVQGRDLIFKELSLVTFYENGSLLTGILFDNTLLMVQDKQVLIRGGGRKTIWLYEDGALKSGYLAESTELYFEGSSTIIDKNSYINLDNEGTLIKYGKDGDLFF